MVIIYVILFALLIILPVALVAIIDGIVEFHKEMRENNEYRRNDKR